MSKMDVLGRTRVRCVPILLALTFVFVSGCSKGPDKKDPAPTDSSAGTQAPQKQEPQPQPPGPQPPAPGPSPQPGPTPVPPAPTPTPVPPAPTPKPPVPPKPPAPTPVPPSPKPEPVPGPNLGAPAWGSSPERRVWTSAVRGVVYAHLAEFERAADREVFCPGYGESSLDQRLNCWVLLVSAVSKFESNFHAGDMFREPDGNYSVGLLALSPGDCPNLHTVQQLAQAVPNLICGTSRMAHLIAHDGYIDGPEERRGASRYWSTLRPPYRRWDPTRNRYLNLGYKNRILPLVRIFRGGQRPLKAESVALPRKAAKTVVAADDGNLLSCRDVEVLGRNESSGQTVFRSADLSIVLRSSAEVPSGVVAELRHGGRLRTLKDSQLVTIPAGDAGQALDIAHAVYPERDFTNVKSVRVASLGDNSRVTLYELVAANGASLAKVVAAGWNFGRCR